MATHAKLRKPVRTQQSRTPFSLVLGDANAMGLWVFLSAINEELGAMVSDALGIPPMAAGLAVLCLGLAVYGPVAELVGGKGASFNPSQNFAFAAAGKGSIRLHMLRSLAQTIAGSLGAFAALRIIPDPWQSKFGNYAHGVIPGVTLTEGFFSEALLSLILNLVILWSMETKLKKIAALAPYIATVILIPLGSRLSGPFMNPAFAFSWFYHLKGANVWEHFLVFWGGCLSGSYASGLVWCYLTRKRKHRKPPMKEKTEERRGAQLTAPESKKDS